jgi:hypothetical protein
MSQAQQEVQMCDWCKGKGVPSHRPKNCRDRANRASRFYEAPSAEQDQEDQKAKKAKVATESPPKAACGDDAFRSKKAAAVAPQAAPFLFGGGMFGAPPRMELDFVNGFMGSNYQRPAATPFTFTPLVSAFPPGGCSAVPFKPNY